MLENSEIEKLKTSLRGQLIVPNESDYDSARSLQCHDRPPSRADCALRRRG